MTTRIEQLRQQSAALDSEREKANLAAQQRRLAQHLIDLEHDLFEDAKSEVRMEGHRSACVQLDPSFDVEDMNRDPLQFAGPAATLAAKLRAEGFKVQLVRDMESMHRAAYYLRIDW